MRNLLLSVSVGLMMLFGSAPVLAANLDPQQQACQGANLGGNTQCDDKGLTDVFGNIIKGLLYIVGAAAILMIIISGLRLVFSAGNEDAVRGAKSALLYAVIGLIVAVLAYAIVRFVFAKLEGQ